MTLVGWFVAAFLVHFLAFIVTEGVTAADSLWVTWQTFTTVGYGDQPAVTPGGRALTMVVSTLGIALLGATFTAAFDLQQYNRERRRLGHMQNPYKDGYVIINYPGEHSFRSFVRETRSFEPEVPICLVDGRLEEMPSPFALEDRLHFVNGELLDAETYRKAALDQQKVVIIFPRDQARASSDGTTRTVVDLVRRFTGENTRILHVLVDSANDWLFDDVPSTAILENMEILVAVQECQDPHSAEVVETLFRNTRGPSPATVSVEGFIGVGWYDFAAAAARASAETGVAVTPLALIRSGRADFSPAGDAVIEEDDLLSVVMNDAEVDWRSHREEIVRRLG